MYQVYRVIDAGNGPYQFVLRADVGVRREAVQIADNIRREVEAGKRNKAAIYDGDRLVQPVF